MPVFFKPNRLSRRDKQRDARDIKVANSALVFPHMCRPYRTSTQAVNGEYKFSWQVDSYTNTNMWTIGDPTKIYLPSPGMYSVTGHISWTSGSAVLQTFFIKLNDGSRLCEAWQNDAADNTMTIHINVKTTTTTDYLSAFAWTSASRTLRGASSETFLDIIKIV